MTDASEALDRLPPERKPPDPITTRRPGPDVLPGAGNAAIARMLSGTPAAPALAELSPFAGNAQIARLAEQGDGAGAPPAPPVGAPAAAGVRFGAHGEAVRDAQVKLSRVQASALPLTEDGRFGPLTEAAVRTFQTTAGITPVTGVLDPVTQARLDAAFAALPPPVRAVLTMGSTGADVAFAQQKLNALGASPRLAVNAVFDGSMLVAVIAYEIAALKRFPTGTVDAAMWADLDAKVKGGFVAPEGAVARNVEQDTPSDTANSLGTQVAGTSLHPVTGVGGLTQGPAVQELQQKLNKAGAAPPLVVDGVFGPKTTAALQAFQTGKVPVTGTADKATWDALDAVAPGSTVGAVERQWTEVVGGATYGMTGASASRYSWEIQAKRMLVTVKVNFTGLPAPAAWFSHVQTAWNQYMGVEPASGKQMPVDFRMVRGAGGDASTVNVVAGTGRANAGTWYAADPNASSTVPHEFGHLIGLQDEYQLHPGDYVRATGHEPPVGDATGPGIPPATIATNLQNAMVARNSANARAASTGAGVREGAFAQQVVAAYAKLATTTVPAVAAAPGPPPVPAQPAVALTGDLIFDLNAALPDDNDRYATIQVFSYSSASLLGDPGREFDPHDHGAQPRHVAEFMAILGQALGGTWEAKRR
ncbi:peptidoglycan-binding protein [Actinoplanes sp. KI2]|uniref:peptidoglycan-binding domain-containing protein n=1 Tax=Actinoplanes sp. KI2 TaxID=2983315 RepID=UPI0021D5A98A|nr:peptidoglycan-binding protein [Actinoplanes sp. KI2]MCU7729175.1 peptidoglycan-binding protein [Actinoplanes sp. KI2]